MSIRNLCEIIGVKMNLKSIQKKIAILKRAEERLLKSKNAQFDKIIAQVARKGLSLEDFYKHLGSKVKGKSGVTRNRKSKLKSKDNLHHADDGRVKVAAKYRDDSGNVWSGRGKPPRWLVAFEAKGGKRESLRIS